ncbi:MAG: hypothetical protein J0H68_02865 [Sphingobacteriia bacterium]|nr:hypothetical protein [Sphingobacteriia bacterium]
MTKRKSEAHEVTEVKYKKTKTGSEENKTYNQKKRKAENKDNKEHIQKKFKGNETIFSLPLSNNFNNTNLSPNEFSTLTNKIEKNTEILGQFLNKLVNSFNSLKIYLKEEINKGIGSVITNIRPTPIRRVSSLPNINLQANSTEKKEEGEPNRANFISIKSQTSYRETIEIIKAEKDEMKLLTDLIKSIKIDI